MLSRILNAFACSLRVFPQVYRFQRSTRRNYGDLTLPHFASLCYQKSFEIRIDNFDLEIKHNAVSIAVLALPV